MKNEICQEVDKSIVDLADNPRLRELAMKVIVNEKEYSEDLVHMSYEIHDLDSFRADDELDAKENNLNTPAQFAASLKELKQKYIKLWEI